MNNFNVIPMPRMVKCNSGVVKSQTEVVYAENIALEEEEYILDISELGIRIEYSNIIGKDYADTTLNQLKANGELPCVFIQDKPTYKFRGLLVDSSRHFVTVDKLLQTLDMMAYYKLNRLHLHLTDDQGWRIEIKKYPLLTEKGSIRAGTQVGNNKDIKAEEYGRGLYYTQDDMKKIVAYAKSRHIEIIPEFDLPGHLLAAISNYPQLSCEQTTVPLRAIWGVEDVIGCAGNDELFTFIKDVIGELSDIFTYPMFHIGGDEVPKTKWKACPKCQAKIKELGLTSENQLQGYLTDKVAEYLAQKGKRAVVWDEDLGYELRSDVILQLWRAEKNLAQSFKWLKKNNNAIISYGPLFYFDYNYMTIPLQLTYEYDPKKSLQINADMDKNVLGLECCLWTEWVRDNDKFDFNLYPRMQAFAEVCWTDKSQRNYKNFEMRLSAHLEDMKSKNIGYCKSPLRSCKGLQKLKIKKAIKGCQDGYGEFRYNQKL